MTSPVLYEGDYVLTIDGKKDFGEISEEIAQIIMREKGKIRLRKGQQNNNNGDFGEKHIERPERLKQLKQLGFENARDFIAFICNNFDEIY